MRRFATPILLSLTLAFGASSVRAGDFEEALKIVKDPNLFSTRAADAERLFRSAAQANQRAKESWYNLGLLLMRRGDLAGARSAFQTSVGLDASFRPAKAQLLGLDLAEPSRAAGAVADLEQIAKDDPFQADAQNLLTSWKLERATELARTDKKKAAEMFEAARAHARNVLAGDPDNIHAYLNVAITYFREGLFDQAGLVASSALEKHSDAASLHNVMGLVYLSQDNSRAATDAFLAALKDDPQNDDVRLNLGALELAYGNFDSALKRFDEVLKQRPDDAELIMSRGVALRGLGRFDEAEQAYLAAQAKRPGLADTDYNLCVLHQQYTQKYEAAKTRCEAYLARIDKTNPKYAEVAKRVKSVDATLKTLKKVP
ncbi:MAG: tetratricopeptide repeat protein [Deltaproteobacteria bacterium]|jgi:Flp pilus assembly protein TadD|nr:tetratricopeptide repeat protein [Deltaproteobacteria bacterium]